MNHCEVPLDLLTLIYATSTNTSKWPDFCTALNQFSDTQIMMFGHDVEADKSLGIIAGGIDAGELDRYHAYFASKILGCT